MIRLLSILFLLVFSVSAHGQFLVFGNVSDEDGSPYVGMNVEIFETKQSTVTDEEGFFQFTQVDTGDYALVFDHPYGSVYKVLYVEGEDVEFNVQIRRRVEFDEVIVSSTRLTNDEPFNHEMVDKEYIEQENDGQDVPYIFKKLRSTVVNSDAGNGIGYTGIRIRGLDPGHVNISMNGIPINDSESQLVFWVNMPDILSSTQDIEVQRGLGASSFGTGQFGASLNFNTNKVHIDPYLNANLGGGSFGTYRASVSGGTGLMNKKYTVDGRVSYAHSDGYIDRASSDLRSFYLSGAILGINSSWRLNIMNGHEVTYQAWNGVPATYIDDDKLRTFNSAGMERVKNPTDRPYEDEVDNYTQTHYQLFYNQVKDERQVTFAGYYTRGLGFFENYRADQTTAGYGLFARDTLTGDSILVDDLVVRRWLDNHFYGAIGSWSKNYDRSQIKLGANASQYSGLHFGEVIASDRLGEFKNGLEYYSNESTKSELSAFAKVSYQVSSVLNLYGDVQFRFIDYDYGNGDGDDGELREGNVQYNFLNPKGGVTYNPSDKWKLFGSVAYGSREPNRDDFIEAGPMSQPKAEKMINTEIGIELESGNFQLGAYGYSMIYDDQLVLTGEINDVGEYSRTNVDNSSRTGIELQVAYNKNAAFSANANMTISRNKIEEFDEYIDDWESGDQIVVKHEDTDISFSPSVTAFCGVSYTFFNLLNENGDDALRLTLDHKYVGPQYLDNTQNDNSRLEEFVYGDLTLSYSTSFSWAKSIQFRFKMLNVWNHLYETNGWIYRFRSEDPSAIDGDPYGTSEGNNFYNQTGLFPQAGRNFLITLALNF